MVNHGIITGSLFLLVGVLYDQAHTRNIDDFGGLGAKLPLYTGIMTVQLMASLGLPGLAGFISEFLCFLGAFGQKEQLLWVSLSVIGIVITAAFFLKVLKDVFLGPFNPRWEGHLKEMTGRELLTIVPLVALTLLIGVYPSVLLKMMDATLTNFIRHVVGG
jgi:NADH-quinone oxidoreductase subunit M